MLVTLASKTVGILILAAGGRRSPRNLRINSSRVVQEVELFRAPFLTVFDRGNQRNEVTFDVLDRFFFFLSGPSEGRWSPPAGCGTRKGPRSKRASGSARCDRASRSSLSWGRGPG